MKKTGIVAVVAISVFACLPLCTPALADYNFDGWSVETRTNGTVNGGVFVDSEPWDGTTPLTGNFDVPDGDVKWARLYAGVWGGTSTSTGWMNVTFNGIYDANGLGPIHLQGESDTNPNVWCSGCGKYWIYYDVTDLVIAESTNIATTSKINGSIDGRVYGIVLVVVYEGGDDPKNIQYWINDGSDGLNYKTPHNEGTTDFNGEVDTTNVTRANLTMVHLTAYDPPCSNCLNFNNNPLDTSMITSNTFELNSWNVTGNITSSGNNAWFSRGEDLYISITNAILILEKEAAGKPDLNVTAIHAYHYNTWASPWFNLTNDVDVTVKNNGTAPAGPFDVSLHTDNEFIGKQTVPGLEPGNSTTVKFYWTPIGEDCLKTIDNVCYFNWSHKYYNLTAVVDHGNDVEESDETNNNFTKVEEACYNGYMADHPLENVAHGILDGPRLLFTTGDGNYVGLYHTGDFKNTTYEITLPADARVELAHLNVYYTWQYTTDFCPEMGVNITNQTGTYVVPLKKSYNDIKCQCPGAAWEFPWGNYVYDITDYIQRSGTYVVTVKNNNPDDREFCIAAPGIVLLYEDSNAPRGEYWINEGADVLIGGRRADGGFLSLQECINNATFPGSAEPGEAVTATLGVVSPWAGESGVPGTSNVLYFNDVELGRGVYHGYGEKYNKTIDGITMYIGADNAQIGVNVTDVTSDLQAGDNVVGQGDDVDSMMPADAFLVVTYGEEFFDTGSPANPYPSIFGTHDGTITPTYNITVDTMYTYPCTGTGGHSEYVAFYNATTGAQIANGTWKGYAVSDYHYIEFDVPFVLYENETYNYTIRTGSYPQIHHSEELPANGGIIRCTKFTDTNGKIYYDWIPAIKLYKEKN